MKAMDAIRSIMKLTGTKTSELAFKLGVKQNVLSQRFTQENVSISKLNEMARIMDYKVVIMPRTSRMPDGAIEIE